MLKQRIATAAVLLPVFLIVVFWFSTPWFAVALSLVVLIGAVEWAALVGVKDRIHQLLWLFVFCALLLIFWVAREKTTLFLVMAGSIWWAVALLRLWTAPATPEPAWFRSIAAAITLVPAWASLVYLHQAEVKLVIAVFLIVWLADTGAYFCGRSLGKRKLAPLISPGKTIEGVLGGIVAVVIFAAAGAAWTGVGPDCGSAWVGICVATALVSVVGDLWESKLKRIAGAKDSGALLPGHGGVLDRIDSVTAAAPVFVTGLYLVNVGTPLCGSTIGHM